MSKEDTFTLKEPYCLLCKHWKTTPKNREGLRFCAFVKQFKDKHDSICDHFEMPPLKEAIFWCYKMGQFRSVGYCMENFLRKVDPEMHEPKCKRKCKQGKVIHNAWKKHKLMNGPKKVIRRKKKIQRRSS